MSSSVGLLPSGTQLEKELTELVETFAAVGANLNRGTAALGTKSDGDSLRALLHDLRIQGKSQAKSTLTSLAQARDRIPKLLYDRLFRQYESALASFTRASTQSIRREREVIAETTGQATSADHTGYLSGKIPPVVAKVASERKPSRDSDQGTGHGAVDLYASGNFATGTGQLPLLVPAQQVKASVQRDTAQLHLEIAMETEKELSLLERDMNDLAHVFADCAKLVKEQGKGIDLIEEKTAETVVHTEVAVEELQEARALQGKSRGKMCLILFLIVGIIAIVVVMTIVARKKKK